MSAVFRPRGHLDAFRIIPESLRVIGRIGLDHWSLVARIISARRSRGEEIQIYES